jgi:hypothetical protein
MSRTLIQKYATSAIKDFVERAQDLKILKHGLTKGELKELFVSRVLKSFLSSQFGIGSGIIINRANKQSKQTDIVIYDNRILPPFIQEQQLGVYPAESVIATVEIATTLNAEKLRAAEKKAKDLSESVFDSVFYGFKPLCAVFGFEGGVRPLSDESKGTAWLTQNIECLFNICISNKYCWAHLYKRDKGGNVWTIETDQAGLYGETKRFIALLLDNVRTGAQERFRYFVEQGHWDWLSMYIRG